MHSSQTFRRLPLGPVLLVASVVILFCLVEQGSALRCHHCVCKTDCDVHVKGDLKRTCPSTTDACLTTYMDKDVVQRGCVKKTSKMEKACSSDLCNNEGMSSVLPSSIPASRGVLMAIAVVVTFMAGFFSR